MEQGQAPRGSSHALPGIFDYSKEKETQGFISYGRVLPTLPSNSSGHSPSNPHPCESPANQTAPAQPMRSLHILDFRLPPMDFLVITAPPHYPLFPIKGSPPTLFSGFAHGLRRLTYPELQFLCLFLNKLAFVGKITGYCIIKVDREMHS